MRLLAIALASVLVIAACDQVTEQIIPTREDKTFTMTVEKVPESQITETCSKLGVHYDANGCAAFDLDTKHCTIFVVEPRHVDDTERFAVIGHETWHCMNGRWHE